MNSKLELFVDCDWTIRQPSGQGRFIDHPDQQKVIEGADQALQSFKNKGYIILGVTNQAGVAARHKTLKNCIKEQQKTLKLLPQLKGIIFCPDYGATCYYCERHYFSEVTSKAYAGEYRKPKPGMILQFKTNGSSALMVGDRNEDAEAAVAAGIPFMWTSDWLAKYGS